MLCTRYGREAKKFFKLSPYRFNFMILVLLSVLSFFIFCNLMLTVSSPAIRISCSGPMFQPDHLRQQNSPGNPTPSVCLPIKATSDLYDTTAEEISGKFMEKSDPPRKLMKFRHEPKNIIALPDTCKQFKGQIKWSIVFFVKSTIINFDRRKALRDTWGSIKFYNSALIRVIFIIGITSDEKLQQKINNEIKQHHDILQIDLEDSSRTVPLKVLAGMQWSAENLSPQSVHVSVDDDMIVFVPNLVRYLNKLFQPLFRNQSNKLSLPPCYEDLPVICVHKIKRNDRPERRSSSKWYVSKQEYPGSTWPVYCRGGLYLMSNKLAADIFEASRDTAYLSMDDVWITGFMRRKLGMGDCNIMGSPYSGAPDAWIWDPFYDDGGDKAFSKHLWGNIVGWDADIAMLMHREWNGWKKRVKWNGECVNTS